MPPGGVSQEDREYVATHVPILSEVGLASWYTAPYKGRKAANGEVFDDNALTAAHRTLPMGSLIVVTNLKTGQSSAMRISDRGPFVADRMIDLTIASAKAVGVYQAGLARVRLDVYQTPKPINTGGRWCVQIGAFHNESDALQLKAQLIELYPDANVIEFPGENSFWVRIRPQGDDRAMAGVHWPSDVLAGQRLGQIFAAYWLGLPENAQMIQDASAEWNNPKKAKGPGAVDARASLQVDRFR